jgi:hypothetical protein
MGRHAKLAKLAMRWTAVVFFILAVMFVPFGVAAGLMLHAPGTAPPPGAPGMTMMGGAQGTAFGPALANGALMMWGPVLLNVVMGVVLFAMSRSIGSVIAAGLDD